MDPDIAKKIHELNAQSHALNQNIVQSTSSMQEVPVDRSVYEEAERARQRLAGNAPPVPQHQPHPQPPPQQQYIQQAPPQPVVQQVIQQDLDPLIDRVTSLENQITKFVTLIERQVAKNAKEITIRIKLNENNDSTDKQ